MTIKGGFILQARATDNSQIAHKPPHFREIFNWLYRQANYKDNGIYKRGQCFTSYKKIREGLSWYIGYRKMMYSKHDCENAMKALKKAAMVTATKAAMRTATKAAMGMVVTICNYDLYQNPDSYESRNESRNENRNENCNENCPYIRTRKKERKKEKNIKENTIFIPPSLEVIILYIKEKGYNVDAEYFFDKYENENPPWSNNRGKVMTSWKSTLSTWNQNSKTDEGRSDRVVL